MSSTSISQLSNSFLSSILSPGLQAAGAGVNSAASAWNAGGTSGPSDNGQISNFAQVLVSLQQLQQSNPTQYQQVTQQIATNLQSAAQTATTDGDTSAANQLNQLATDFSSASQSGQLPNISDLAQAAGGAHHHHHHGHMPASNSDSTSSTSAGSASTGSAATSSTATGSTNPFLAALQASSGENDAANALSIIASTLASAGVTASPNS